MTALAAAAFSGVRRKTAAAGERALLLARGHTEVPGGSGGVGVVVGDGGAAAEQKLAVTLVLTKDGHYLAASDGSFQAVPKGAEGKYDFPELKRQLIRWKEEFQLAEGITVTPEADIEYAVVVETMDNIRRYEKGWLFPDVVLGKAAEAQR